MNPALATKDTQSAKNPMCRCNNPSHLHQDVSSNSSYYICASGMCDFSEKLPGSSRAASPRAAGSSIERPRSTNERRDSNNNPTPSKASTDDSNAPPPPPPPPASPMDIGDIESTIRERFPILERKLNGLEGKVDGLRVSIFFIKLKVIREKGRLTRYEG